MWVEIATSDDDMSIPYICEREDEEQRMSFRQSFRVREYKFGTLGVTGAFLLTISSECQTDRINAWKS